MSGNLPFPFYSRLKKFLTRPLVQVIYYEALHSTSLVLQFNSLTTKETKWKLNHFSQTLLFTVTLKNCFWSFEMMVNIQIHCAVRCGDQQLRCTHCTYGLFQFGSAASPWNTTVIPPGGEGTSFSKPLWNYWEKGMRCSRTLSKTILIKATSSSSITSSFAIQKIHVGVFSKSVLNHVALTLKDTWMRLEPAPRGRRNVNWHHMIRPKHPSSCNSAGRWIAKLLLVETRNVSSGSACF